MKAMICILPMIFWVVPQIGLAAEPSANEIMEKNFQATRVKDSKAESTMKLMAGSGQERVRKLKIETRLVDGKPDNMILTVFDFPADVKGTKTLMIENTGGEDNMWIYLPAMKKVRRLSSNNKKDAFVGSDFSFGDIMGHKVGDWKHRLLRKEDEGGEPCYVIESVTANDDVKSSSGYSKRISWIGQKSFVARRGEIYDESGTLAKKFSSSNVKKIDEKNGKWQPLKFEVENVQTRHKTLIEYASFEANVNVPKEHFSVRFLETK